MSLHLNQQCQRADASPSPLSGAIVLPIVKRRKRVGHKAVPAGEGPYMSAFRGRQWLFREIPRLQADRPAEARRPAASPCGPKGNAPPAAQRRAARISRTRAAPFMKRWIRHPCSRQSRPQRPSFLDFQRVSQERSGRLGHPRLTRNLFKQPGLLCKAARKSFSRLSRRLGMPRPSVQLGRPAFRPSAAIRQGPNRT